MISGLVLGVIFILLLVLNIPIALSLGLSSIAVILWFNMMPLAGIPTVFYGTLEKFPLLAIPFFIFAGIVMERGGISRKLVDLVNGIIGKVSGGLAYVVIVVSLFLAGISGSGPADTAALGSVLIPSMTRLGYHKDFCSGLIAVTGAIGIIIPPSIAFIVYGIVSNTSIVDLFIAGIVPGVMIGIAVGVPTYFISKKRNYTGEERASLKQIAKNFRSAIWGLLAPLIVLFGLYFGIFTTTEVAIVLSMYVVFVTMFIYKNINLRGLFEILGHAAVVSGMVLLIIGTASLFTWVLTTQGVSAKLGDIILAFSKSPILFLLFTALILLIAGCFIETNAIIFMFTPIFLPIATRLGIDPIYLGVVMTVNLAIGEATPPLGVNLFVVSGIADLKIEEVAKAAYPFILAEIGALLLMILFPDAIMWFPRLLKH